MKRILAVTLIILSLMLTACDWMHGTAETTEMTESSETSAETLYVATREYFENLPKSYSLEQIESEIGPSARVGSGIIYFVWHLDDGTMAYVVFSSEAIVRIYIVDGDKSELIYNKYTDKEAS